MALENIFLDILLSLPRKLIINKNNFCDRNKKADHMLCLKSYTISLEEKWNFNQQ